MDLSQLFDLYSVKLSETDAGFVRYLHDRINWNSRLIAIVGARGVGKTTMVLQHILLTDAVKESLYIPGEEWRDIPGFEGIYAVSNLGRVKSLERDSEYYVKGQKRVRHYGESLMKQYEDQDGYLQCHLQDHGREVYCNVHRYVAQAFISNPNGLPEVNHIDGDKHNNKLENLEWCDNQYNVSHALETGLRGSQKGYDRTVKRVRCTDLNLEFNSISAAAIYFGYSYTGLGKILKEGKKLYHGHHFEYIDK